MYKGYKIRPPFFEIGPKCYMWGQRFLKLCLAVDEIAGRYDLDVIVTPQYADIRLIASTLSPAPSTSARITSAPCSARRWACPLWNT